MINHMLMIMNWVKVKLPLVLPLVRGKKLPVPSTGGCYLLVNNDGEVVYAGRTMHLRTRARHHRSAANQRSNFWDKQYFIYCECDKQVARILEPMLIQKYCPIHNTLCKPKS